MAQSELNRFLSDEHLDSSRSLHNQFEEARPFRHLVLESFFTDDFATQLQHAFPPFDEKLAINENGEVGRKCVHENLLSLGGPWKQLDELIRSRAFLDWVGEMTGIEDLLYDPHYFGGGTHENRHGQDLDPHVDFNHHPFTRWHRRLNLIVYLNDEWQPEWDGAIEFHKDPRLHREQNEVKVIQPQFNRAVLFETTHWSWHGFERINLPQGDDDRRSRKPVALYFYSEDRPDEEKVKPHSTIYVERPLPERIQAGSILSEEDFNTVERLLARRDQHLQRLYRNLSDLSKQLEVAQARPSPEHSIVGRLRRRAGAILRRLGLRR
jgi:hypothetical protein